MTVSSIRKVARRRPNGFIIVAALWVLSALAALVSIYAVYVMDTANAFSGYEDRLQSEELTSAAIELTALQLTATPAQSRPSHGAFSFQAGRANVLVSFESEASRIDLNAASKELLTSLFASLGENSDQAANDADAIVQWRGPTQDKNSATSGPARDINAPSGAPDKNTATSGQTSDLSSGLGSQFFNVEELALVPGLPADIVEHALPLVTVDSGRPQVNIFSALPAVLAALPGTDQSRLNAILAQRALLTDDLQLAQLLGQAHKYVTTEGGNTFRIIVQIVYENGRSANSEVSILLLENDPAPYAILAWQDEMSPRANEARRVVSQ